MAEYIDKQALNEYINKRLNNSVIKGWIKSIINKIPTADVVEVRHGKWDINKNCSICGVYKFEGLDADVWADWDIDYCPNCGAKMDGKDGEG